MFLGVLVWGCFRGFLVVWRVFLSPFGAVLVLFSYWMATVLLEGSVGVGSGCFSRFFRCLAGFSGFFWCCFCTVRLLFCLSGRGRLFPGLPWSPACALHPEAGILFVV